MFRRLSSGDVVNPDWTLFTFPTSWHYDVLRGLDYLRDAGTQPAERVAEAIRIVEGRRREDGRWPLDYLHADRLGFPFEAQIGKESRWNTLRALRVLKWYSAPS